MRQKWARFPTCGKNGHVFQCANRARFPMREQGTLTKHRNGHASRGAKRGMLPDAQKGARLSSHEHGTLYEVHIGARCSMCECHPPHYNEWYRTPDNYSELYRTPATVSPVEPQ
ncbi:hypothetical protein D8674_004762 [Pyrus ussuriensis x Pyrus communis]|uniref:Uncharacterized protein n=1 Tax=Pyrus ussuriensis x Pyrus communis TaxID=2448454 RepID=A0A5N5FPM8_9ROSA|nr:hypothetical protein D8674_004762 [Pyrus ussuriensis x Pyrus communis]